MNKLSLLAVSFLSAITLAGCGGDDEQGLGNGNDDLGVQQTRYNGNTNIAPNRERINMDADEFGPDYYNGQGLQDDGRNNLTQNENDGNFHNNNVDRVGPNNTAQNRGTNVNFNNNDNDGYDLADKVADQITSQVQEVDRAYVFTGPENTYVAVGLESDRNLTDSVEEKIRRAAKSADNDIDDVFISANPDFLKQAGDYANQIEAGDPVQGLFKEMGDMFQRVFPND